MLWPREKAVHSRTVEQLLTQIETDIFRMRQESIFMPFGNLATSNNFPLPPVPADDCSTTCIDGTPTILVGSTYVFRRQSIDDSLATGPVNLDYSNALGYWVSGTVALDTPLVCSGLGVILRWKMTAAGVGVGQVTLILQYDIGSGWTNGPTWLSTAIWNPHCGLSFTGGAGFPGALSCNQSAPTDVCVNPINLCVGEDPSTFFVTSRVFTFTVAGVGGTTGVGLFACSVFNRSWSLAYSTGAWRDSVSPGGNSYQAALFKPGGSGFSSADYTDIRFTPPQGSLIFYRALKCDVTVPGVTVFDLVAGSTTCTGWPSTINVTCT